MSPKYEKHFLPGKGPFIKYVINQGRGRGLPKDDFIHKAYLVNVMTEGEGVKNLKKLMTSFMNVHQAKKEDQHTVIINVIHTMSRRLLFIFWSVCCMISATILQSTSKAVVL